VTSKVKKAKDIQTQRPLAIKIHRNPTDSEIESLSKEIEVLQNIPHKHLIGMVDFYDEAMVQEVTNSGLKDYKEYQAIVILELAEGQDMI
jgi:serine/threonine protein kinase